MTTFTPGQIPPWRTEEGDGVAWQETQVSQDGIGPLRKREIVADSNKTRQGHDQYLSGKKWEKKEQHLLQRETLY